MALALLLATGAWAKPPPPATPEGVLSFADTLLRSGDSFRAATEYLRFLHHFPEDPRAPRALEGLGRAYALAGRWAEAAGAFARLSREAPSPEARRLLAGALYRGGRPLEAARLLLAPGAGEPDRVLGTLALLRAGRPREALPGVRTDIVEKYEALPRKSPFTAAALAAVLPGAGHLYVGRPRDAAVSFVLNGVFLWGTWRAARNEQWALAGVLGLFEAGWYGGNVVSAANGAHKWNRREARRFFSRWEAGVMPRWDLVVLPGGGGALRVSWRW